MRTPSRSRASAKSSRMKRPQTRSSPKSPPSTRTGQNISRPSNQVTRPTRSRSSWDFWKKCRSERLPGSNEEFFPSCSVRAGFLCLQTSSKTPIIEAIQIQNSIWLLAARDLNGQRTEFPTNQKLKMADSSVFRQPMSGSAAPVYVLAEQGRWPGKERHWSICFWTNCVREGVNLPMTKVKGLCLPCGQAASCDAFRIRLFA